MVQGWLGLGVARARLVLAQSRVPGGDGRARLSLLQASASTVLLNFLDEFQGGTIC